MNFLDIIHSIGASILLWMGIAFTVIGHKNYPFAYLGLAIIFAYSLFTKMEGYKQ